MPTRKVKYFRVIYYDRDNLTCNISEIITDDTEINEKTCNLLYKGRNVNVSATVAQIDRNKVDSKESLLKTLPRGYRYDPNLSW